MKNLNWFNIAYALRNFSNELASNVPREGKRQKLKTKMCVVDAIMDLKAGRKTSKQTFPKFSSLAVNIQKISRLSAGL